MNICLLSNGYPPYTKGGGVGTYTYNLSRGLAALGHNVCVIARWVNGAPDTHYLNGVKVYRVKKRPVLWISNLRKLFWLGERLEWALNALEYSNAVYHKILDISSKEKIDIIESAEFNAEGFIYLVRKRYHRPIPLVIKLHKPLLLWEIDNHIKRSISSRLICLFEKISILKADALYSPTNYLAERIASTYKIFLRNIHIVHNPIDTKCVIPLTDSSKTDDKIKIFYVGRIEHTKGPHVLIKAIPKIVEKYKNIKFIFLGRDTMTGPKGKSLKQYLLSIISPEYLQYISFEGEVDKQRLIESYNKCDIFVSPSINENFSMAMGEAMAYGKAIVASDSGGTPEILEDGKDGLVVETGNPESLSLTILRLVYDPLLRRELGKNARQKVEVRYTLEKVAEQTINFYNTVFDKIKYS